MTGLDDKLAAGAVAVRTAGRSATRAVVDLLFPQVCALCERETLEPAASDGPLLSAAGLCGPCFGQLHFLTPPYCGQCGLPFQGRDQQVMGIEGFCAPCLTTGQPFGQMRAALAYSDAAKRLVIRFKHLNQPELARLFAGWMAQAAPELLMSADYIVATPVHWRRLFKRQYNQATLLAKQLDRVDHRLSGSRLALRALVRTRSTTSMGQLSARDRQKNIRGAIALAPRWRSRLRHKTVLLIDDVYASGATSRACIKVLRQAGVRDVNLLVLARSL